MTLVIGLTGSIATGKSTISTMFSHFNIPVIDADQISREVVKQGKKAYFSIVEYFGEDILQKNKDLDRKKLGKIVFNNKHKLNRLNKIVHPEIKKEMEKKRNQYVKDGVKAIVLDIPLLFENKLTYLVDKTLLVYTTEKVQLERLIKREGFSLEEAKNRILLQISIERKRHLADYIIDNNGTKEQSFQQLRQLLKEWEII